MTVENFRSNFNTGRSGPDTEGVGASKTEDDSGGVSSSEGTSSLPLKASSPKTDDFHSDIPVGEVLRRTRVYYGKTLEQVEGVLRIRASQLQAIEVGDISKLPGRAYAIGFVRSYSEYLGLDGNRMVQLFKEQNGGRQKRVEHTFPAPVSESKIPNKIILLSSIGISVFFLLLLFFFVFSSPEEEQIPSVPEEMTHSRLNEAPALILSGVLEKDFSSVGSPPSADPSVTSFGSPVLEDVSPTVVSTSEPVPQPSVVKQVTNRLQVYVTQPSWIEVRNASGEAILRRVMRPGDVYVVPNEEGLVMHTGNAGGVEILLDGRSLGKLGQSAEVRKQILLDPQTLAAGPAL